MRLEAWIPIYFLIVNIRNATFLLEDKRQWTLEEENVNGDILSHGSEITD